MHRTRNFFLLLVVSVLNFTFAQVLQNNEVLVNELLFSTSEVLPVSITCSKKQIRKETNDSTYINTQIFYKQEGKAWDSLSVKMRSRGNFRKKTCAFTPLKIKIKKSESKGTIFEGQKSFKVVMPCLNESAMNDNILKEYLIYKMYEIISPYAFKTRLIDLKYEELRNKKSKHFRFRGFLLEDDSKMAKRVGARVAKRKIFPQGYDNDAAVTNAMFNFMIGNTDFSVTYSHNCKPIYVNKSFVPVSYDFDLAGFVNTSYSVVSKTRRERLPIEKVTQRYYMGYQRDYSYFLKTREKFLAKQEQILTLLERHKLLFDNQNTYNTAKSYIQEFFKILQNEKKFKQKTYDQATPI